MSFENVKHFFLYRNVLRRRYRQHLHPPIPRCTYLFIVLVVDCRDDEPDCNADSGYRPIWCPHFPHVQDACPHMCRICWTENIRGTRHWGLNWQTKPSVHFLQLCVDVLYPIKKHIAVCGVSHYDDVIMTTIASQITSFTFVYSTVNSDADQRKHQSSTSLAFVCGINRDRWIPRTKGQLRGKCFHLMTSSCNMTSLRRQNVSGTCSVSVQNRRWFIVNPTHRNILLKFESNYNNFHTCKITLKMSSARYNHIGCNAKSWHTIVKWNFILSVTTGVPFIKVWISNRTPCNIWDEIYFSFIIFNCRLNPWSLGIYK